MTHAGKRKGITPIVAIVILLLITVAIAGSAYTWLGGYYTGLTGKAIQVTDITCTSSTNTTVIRFTNIGTQPLTSAEVSVTRTTFGNTPSTFGGASLSPTTVNPGVGGSLTDTNTNTTGVTYKYFIEIGGRTTTNQVTC